MPADIENQEGLPVAERTRAMLALCMSTGMAVLDTAIANIALPTIASDLHALPASSIWVVNAYQVTVTVALLPCASLGDILGFRRVYMVGMMIFTLASLACSLAHTLPLLVAARTVQGLGAAGIMSVNLALVRQVYPRARLGAGIGLITLTVALSSAAGPSIAAAVLGALSWPWLFAINVPVGLAALALARRSIPLGRKSGERFDWTSAALNAATFGLLILLVDAVGAHGGGVTLAVGLVALSVVGTLFIRRQLRLPAPMLPVDLMRMPLFALSVVTSVCSYSAQSLAYVALPFFFQVAGGQSTVATGLLITPWPAVLVIVAPLAGRLSDRYPAGLLGGIGLAIMTAGLLSLMLVAPDASYANIAWRMVLSGIGFGFFQTPNNRAMIASAPPDRAGAAGGMVSTARLLGQSLGAALLAICFSLSPDIATGAVRALGLGAAFTACGAVASVLRLRSV